MYRYLYPFSKYSTVSSQYHRIVVPVSAETILMEIIFPVLEKIKYVF